MRKKFSQAGFYFSFMLKWIRKNNANEAIHHLVNADHEWRNEARNSLMHTSVH